MSTTNYAPRTNNPGEFKASSNDESILRLENVSKQYPGTLAVDSMNFDVKPGEVHILFGENGAGKSTLIQMVAGVHKPTSGKIFLNGNEVDINSVHHARDLGVSAVFQEFSLIPQLTVEENLFLGSEESNGPFLKKAELHRLAKETLDRLGFPLKPNDIVMNLSRAEHQMIEIAKAFRSKPNIMILDEPTASLTERETDQLFELVASLKKDGIGIIYITHRMKEIARIGDRVTVLRDGKFIATVDMEEATESRLVELMTGRVVDQVFPEIKNQAADNLLEIDGLRVKGNVVNNASINVRAGEVVGIAGLVGCGKSEVGRAAFGIEDILDGKITFCGETLYDSNSSDNNTQKKLNPRKMLDRGLYYVPSDRRVEGLVMNQSVRHNVSLPSLSLSAFTSKSFLRRKNEKAVVQDIAERLELAPLDIDRKAESFSGGNQQKALIGKALVRDVKLFIFDEPTVGVDVGARVLIYRFIRDLCEAGAGVLLISSDLPEILNLTHRSYVMYRGQIRAHLQQDELEEQNVLSYFFEEESA